MKFLLFNLVVAASLVYLFTADRADVRSVADGAYDTAGEIKEIARDAIGKGREMLGREREPDTMAAPPPVPPVREPKKATDIAAAPPPTPTPATPTAVPPAPPPKAIEQVLAAPQTLPPDVAQRRREVLAPVLRDGERLMSADQRRKELLSLAEEMELLYARKVSR